MILFVWGFEFEWTNEVTEETSRKREQNQQKGGGEGLTEAKRREIKAKDSV